MVDGDEKCLSIYLSCSGAFTNPWYRHTSSIKTLKRAKFESSLFRLINYQENSPKNSKQIPVLPENLVLFAKTI